MRLSEPIRGVESLDVVLVDTSIWIAHLDRNILQQHVALSEVTTCPPIVQEVLQGIRDEHAYTVTRTTMFALQMLESPLSSDVFEEAAQIYRTGRITGFTIRSPFDCLIAACAIRNDVPLLHSDRDFNTIARFTRLQSRYVAL
jgi:predicted nucleic acid-binding protein